MLFQLLALEFFFVGKLRLLLNIVVVVVVVVGIGDLAEELAIPGMNLQRAGEEDKKEEERKVFERGSHEIR